MDFKKFFKARRDELQQGIYFVINPFVGCNADFNHSPNEGIDHEIDALLQLISSCFEKFLEVHIILFF